MSVQDPSEVRLPPKYLIYTDYLVNFELFYKNIRNLDILSDEGIDFVKTRTKETSLSSYRKRLSCILHSYQKFRTSYCYVIIA